MTMTITEKQLTSELARSLREENGMTQSEFWNPVGVQQSVACRYEKNVKIPRPVRILVVARYVAGLKISAETAEDLADLQLMADVQRKLGTARSLARQVSKDLDGAARNIAAAKASLTGI